MRMDNAVGGKVVDSEEARLPLPSRLGRALPGLLTIVVTVLIGAALSAAPLAEAARDVVTSPLLWMVVVVFLMTSVRASQAPAVHDDHRTPVRRLAVALYWFTAGQLLLAAVFGMDLFSGWYAVPSDVLLGLGGASCLGESWRLLTGQPAPTAG